MRFSEVKCTIWCWKRTAMNFHNINLTTLRPLSVIAFVCRHHPECWQKSFAAWYFCLNLKSSILEIVFSLCVNSSWCIMRFITGSFLNCLNIKLAVFYIDVFLCIYIFLQFCIYPTRFMIFIIPVIGIEIFSLEIILPYELIRRCDFTTVFGWNHSRIFRFAAAAYLSFQACCVLCSFHCHNPPSIMMS